MGVINPDDPQMSFNIFKLFGMPELMEDYRLDWTQANQENDQYKEWAESITADPAAMQQFQMAQQAQQDMAGVGAKIGQPPAQLAQPPIPQPLPWETHMVHIYIHRQFLLSDFFRALPPPLQQPMLMHMQMHTMLAAPAPAQGGGAQPSDDTTNTEANKGGQSNEAVSGNNQAEG